MDDTDASNDELIRDKQEARSTSQLHPPQSTSHRDKDHYVTVFTISNGEVTFQRSGSQQWFSEASADESAKTQAQTVHVTHAHRPRASSTSPDRKRYPSVTSCSHDRKYIALPAPGSQSDGPIRKYDREAILRRHLRGGRRTDYGFIDGAVVLADYDGASLCSGDAVPAGSALTDDQKVAARICNGSLQGTTSPEIILVHPNQQVFSAKLKFHLCHPLNYTNSSSTALVWNSLHDGHFSFAQEHFDHFWQLKSSRKIPLKN